MRWIGFSVEVIPEITPSLTAAVMLSASMDHVGLTVARAIKTFAGALMLAEVEDATNNPASTDHPSYGSRRALQRWAPVS